MILDLAMAMSLAAQCAPGVAPQTLLPIVQVESGFDSLAIGVNRRGGHVARPTSAEAAASTARALLASGANLDLGLAQINSRNLDRLGLSLEEAFEPCRNLAAGARLLGEAYRTTRRTTADPQMALRGAISIYNTGDRQAGHRNGYVAKVEQAARRLAPRLPGPAEARANTLAVAFHDAEQATTAADVFGQASNVRALVFPTGDLAAAGGRP